MAKREMRTVKTAETEINENVNETVVEDVVIEEPVEEIKPLTVTGIVTDCSRLNVRKKANVKSDVVSIINAKTEVVVYPDDSTKEWYKVVVNGCEGFCMKKFITIKD